MLYVLNSNHVIMYDKHIFARTGDIFEISDITKDNKTSGYLMTNLITGIQEVVQSKVDVDKIAADCESLSEIDFIKRLVAIDVIKKRIINTFNEQQKKAQEESGSKLEIIDDNNRTKEETKETKEDTSTTTKKVPPIDVKKRINKPVKPLIKKR